MPFRFRKKTSGAANATLSPRLRTIRLQGPDCFSLEDPLKTMRLIAFKVTQTIEPHTLSLALPGESILRRLLRAAVVLTIRSAATSLHTSVSPPIAFVSQKRQRGLKWCENEELLVGKKRRSRRV